MKEAVVSVVIAAYNVENYIANCIESILKQTYKYFELIIVDDGSTDNTKSLIMKYAEADNRIKAYFQTNRGVGSARNEGLKHVTGEFITFIDADDEIACRYLEYLLKPCINEDADISVCFYQYTNEGDRYDPVFTNQYNIMDVDYQILQAKIIGRCCGTLIKREHISDTFFDTDLYVGEDLLFFCRALAKSKRIAITDDKLYCYYIYQESSYNGTYNDKKFTEIESWNRVIKLFKNKPYIFQNTLKRLYGWILLNNLMRMEEYNYHNKRNEHFCLSELRRMKKYVFNRYPGGGKRSIAMYPIYLITCLSPRAGYLVFSSLMKLKHGFGN